MDLAFLTDFIAASIRLSTPLLLAALGGIVAERSGIITIGLEGMMLAGAFGGFAAAIVSGSVWIGVAAAAAGGAAVGLLHGVLSIRCRADQIISGAATNLLAAGLTSFFYFRLYGIQPIPPRAPTMQPVSLPVVGDLPLVGGMLFHHLPLVFVAVALVPIFQLALFHTSWGLALRAVGEHPRAADTAGIDVWRVRYASVVLGGALAGLGGAFLTLGQLNLFLDGITAGRGFIAYAAIVFGKWNPFMVAGGCLLFGAADALQLRMQGFGLNVPYQLFLMLPYVLTLTALALFLGRVTYPAAAGVAYVKEQG